ncbi:MAG: hypothetical protein RMM31_08220, partial [Anaerolineae bacterium]|nr:hypothetical protein [Anaerolineae bacterium]
ATVVATYYNPDGSIPSGSVLTHTLPVNGRLDITTGQDSSLPSNWSGAVVLSSDQDIIAVAQTKYTGRLVAETLPPSQQQPGTEASVYEAFNAGATEVFFPALVRVKRASDPTVAELTTRYTVMNTSNSPATVHLNYRNFDGTTYPPTIITLAPFGSRTFNTAVDVDLPTGMITAPNTIAFSARVTATQPIVGVAEQSWNFDGFIGTTAAKQNWVADYNAIPASDASTTLFVPNFSRVGADTGGSARPCTFSVYTDYFFYTALAVQNTQNTTATVTAEFFRSNTGSGVNAPSGLATFSHTVQIPPFGTWNLNTFNGGNLGFNQTHPIWSHLSNSYITSTGYANHCNWAGSVRITSNQPLVGFGAIQQPQANQNYASRYNLFGPSGATTTALLARVDRVCTGTCNPSEVGLFPHFAGLNVQNVGTATTTVTLVFYNANGTVNQTYTVDSGGNLLNLVPGAQIAFNTSVGSNYSNLQTQQLGNNFKGTVRVTSTGGVPIRAFANLISGMDDADAYLGANR